MIPIAVFLVGLWLIIDSQEAPSTTLTLIFGLVVAVLALIELLPIIRSRI